MKLMRVGKLIPPHIHSIARSSHRRGKKNHNQSKQNTLFRHQKPQTVKGCTTLSNWDVNGPAFRLQ